MSRDPEKTDTSACISLVRHGAVHNPGHILYGRLPRFRLSAAGRQQATRLALWFRASTPAAVFTSPLLRARQTAREICRPHVRLRPRVSALLNEVRSPYQGIPGAEVDARGGDVYTGAGPGYEQPDDVASRMLRFIDRVRRTLPGRQVVAVTHGDPIAFLLLALFGEPLLPESKTCLAKVGIAGGYPATGSTATLIFRGVGEQRPQVVYRASPGEDDGPGFRQP